MSFPVNDVITLNIYAKGINYSIIVNNINCISRSTETNLCNNNSFEQVILENRKKLHLGKYENFSKNRPERGGGGGKYEKKNCKRPTNINIIVLINSIFV